jgi:hypothetical protein
MKPRSGTGLKEKRDMLADSEYGKSFVLPASPLLTLTFLRFS